MTVSKRRRPRGLCRYCREVAEIPPDGLTVTSSWNGRIFHSRHICGRCQIILGLRLKNVISSFRRDGPQDRDFVECRLGKCAAAEPLSASIQAATGSGVESGTDPAPVAVAGSETSGAGSRARGPLLDGAAVIDRWNRRPIVFAGADRAVSREAANAARLLRLLARERG